MKTSSIRKSYIAAVICLLTMSASISLWGQDAAKSIMKDYQNATRLDNMTSKVTYRHVTKKGKVQERNLEQIIKKQEKGSSFNLVIRFTKPRDVKNTSVLTIQNESKSDDQWLYLPTLKRARKISAGRKKDSFMGTEISYEDLSTYLSEDLDEYQYQMLDKSMMDGSECYKIKAQPAEGSSLESAYAYRILYIGVDKKVNLQTEYYNDSGELIKTYRAWSIASLDGDKYKALKSSMENHKTGGKTIIEYSDINIEDVPEDHIFSINFLESF